MVAEFTIQMTALIGIFMGVLIRTYAPYLRKDQAARDAGQTFKFEWKFIATALLSAIVTAMFVFPTFVVPTGSVVTIFITAFVFAFGANDMLNRLSN